MAPITTPEAPVVVSQDGALVGDEAVRGSTHKVEPQVNTESVPAQVAADRDAPASTVPVHETVVHTDRVITDPSSPEAVQIPDAGRGNASLPIHGLGNPTPEQVFAGEADAPAEEEPAPADDASEGDDGEQS